MQIRYSQLKDTLTHPLPSLMVVAGDDPYLMDDTCHQIKLAAKKQGFSHCDRQSVQQPSDWGSVFSAMGSKGLFEDKTFILADWKKPKFDKGLQADFQSFIAQGSSDQLLVLLLPKLTSAQTKTKWFQALSKNATTLVLYPLNTTEAIAWVRAACTAANLQMTSDAITTLVDLTEGNMLATKQAIQKASLLFSNKTIQTTDLAQLVSDCASFDVFDLTNAMLEGNAAKISRTLRLCEQSGVEPVLLLWALSRELRSLTALKESLNAGQSLEQVLARQWQSKKPLLKAAVTRSEHAQLERALAYCSTVDQTIKGASSKQSPWDALQTLALMGANAWPA